MKQYPSNRVLKKKASSLEIFREGSFKPDQYRNIRIGFSPSVSEIIDDVVILLEEMTEEKESKLTAYFQLGSEDEGFEDLGSEHDTCDDDECIEEMTKSVKEDYPDQNIEISYTHNDGDHDNIGRCQICYKPLNSWLTWVKYESEYFTDENKLWTKDLIENNSFALASIFKSIPSCDTSWEKSQEKWFSLEQHEKKCHKFYMPLIMLAIYIKHNLKK
ncbi:hypothetical protein [Elizabethkingia meningoseptica]|uniref:hypothetical protein n=1 Tax=Elizabethkingia meningoseptica TaxID=238 RepID=UPI00162973E8|nr:hypothetical protein [Elizabethkingia meningoseptica]MBG0512909.1 hypothetical protein [Elizabethkingia meningoseptica]MBG0514063.1 hypothetical protein [Elizabethkingia meningoseptica]MBG0515176.1 hypothetical protein [Elizabethkingia meningoseptica]